MPEVIRPPRLRRGDEIRVVAPSLSYDVISPSVRTVATERFEELGLHVTFGDHIDECDEFRSSAIESRVADLHDAFADPSVNAILTVLGGWNANQLLPHLDWKLIRANPKIFCGYSDITALSGAMLAKAGLATYSGPHYSSFGMRDHFDQTLEWFRAMLFDEQAAPLVIEPPASWSDDEWYLNQDVRKVFPNNGWWVLNDGEAEGQLVGGNLCTFNLLHGTEFMPDLPGTIVLVEDDDESSPATFDRDLTALTQQPGFDDVRGLLIGRFQHEVDMTRDKLTAIVNRNHRLVNMPILANVDFGHTSPMLTLPVGGTAQIRGRGTTSEIRLVG